MGRTRRIAAETVAEAYLALLRDRGVERLFVNAGTDFAPIVEAYARRPESGLDLPEVVVCAHENLAVSMAHGAYLGDGRPQAVMLHTSVGTANAVCGVLTAARSRVPLLVTAGRTPLFEDGPPGAREAGIHWAQEMYDQAGMLREFVKWDYELRDGAQVETVVDRALDVARTRPGGPVYLTLPREVLARPVHGVEVRDGPAAAPVPAAPDPEAVARLADHLAGARLPVVVTAATGADPRTVALLDDLCRRFAVAVVDHRPRYVNVPAGHPLHLGFDVGPVLAEADVLCFLDVDVPWTPGTAAPRDDAVVVQCGPDPHFGAYPIRGHRSDLSITADPRSLLTALAAALEERPIDPGRGTRIAAEARRRRARRLEAMDAAARAGGAITKPFLNRALAEALPGDAVVVNEYWARPEYLGGMEPGGYFGFPPAGGLGWGLPAALGVRLARPDRTVVATLGDGAYLFANPAACHHAMSVHGLPVLTVVAANGRWDAVESAALGMYPDGHAARSEEVSGFSRLDPVPEFAAYAEASGGYGERVTERGELAPALRRALRAVREEGRHALLDVRCA
ncbi:thiamine pyrophosphate-requiring protein [Actinomadura chibensis]|uniref:Thiamine pyrophosphate-requiring protein n=1 Tax=Actinomadura chibensis TaxID=392828 RepID=A0A5D0ND34_9ACTN|nr:thiamine pyrophosphate-requiring protein [Actinomadura chibensis]TYB42444.1 thiamine pyrophosphate-requiring protein [Actinomadura chibensis]